MNHIIIGGDERAPYLYRRLRKEGDGALCFALETAPLPCIAHCDTLTAGDVFILPMPAERDGYLNAPFSKKKRRLREVFEMLPQNAFVCGGKLGDEAIRDAKNRGVRLYDYMRFPALTVGNAAITAEGAVKILMDESPRCLSEQKILILGRGRIGKLLGDKLSALGADVRIASGNPEAAELARVTGFKVLGRDCGTEDADMVVNTAPAVTLSADSQRSFKNGCVLLELASKSGFDRDAVSHCRLINAPGLPAKYAPGSAAELVFDAVKTLVKEHHYE